MNTALDKIQRERNKDKVEKRQRDREVRTITFQPSVRLAISFGTTATETGTPDV